MFPYHFIHQQGCVTSPSQSIDYKVLTLQALKTYNKCNFNFPTPEVVSRYRDPQLQVGENYSCLFNLMPNICKSWCLSTHSIPNTSDLIG